MTVQAPPRAAADRAQPRPRRRSTARGRRASSQWNQGESWIWMTGGSLVLSVFMIVGLLVLVIARGAFHLWPEPIDSFLLEDGTTLMGEVARSEEFDLTPELLDELPPEQRARADAQLGPEGGRLVRTLLRTGNFDLTGSHFHWIDDHFVTGRERPEWAVIVERTTWGRFYGIPAGFELDGELVEMDPAGAWSRFEQHHADVRARWEEARRLEDDDMGAVSDRMEGARLELRAVELEHGRDSDAWRAAKASFDEHEAEAGERYAELASRVEELEAENERYQLVMDTASGQEARLPLAAIVRAYPANQLGLAEKLGVYLSRWWEFLTAEPREANSEGGVFPAIFGTVLMTMIMCVLVVPIGVLAALYLHEYAKPGVLVTTVRIAVNNLAGVPSIVFGVFGLGFFCYFIGVELDQLLFAERLPNPTLGKGGLMWASLTLALLTLPVVIVATEEALAAVPNSMREGSYGCGASKWQTIRKIVLPRALPGILTGAILAIARGAGEVAPLMLVGAVKLAPDLPLAWEPPLMGTERSFMHLGFHIYDLGFQSQNSEAAEPMVFTTTLLLIAIVVALNLTAMWGRGRLRKKFGGAAI